MTSSSGRVTLQNAFLKSPCCNIHLSPTSLAVRRRRELLKLERIVGIFDIGDLQNSLKLQLETWRKVVCHLYRFPLLRRTLRGLPLVSCRPFLGKGGGSSRFSRRPYGR